MSSSDTLTTCSTAVPSRAASTTANSDSRQTTIRAPESASWWRSSRSLYIGLTMVTIPPQCHVACTAIATCGTFWSISATRSPGRSPSSSRRAAARACARSPAARNVIGVSK